MEKIERKDIGEIDSFNKFGSIFKRSVQYRPRNGVYVFERWLNNKLSCLEVVKGKKYTNPDGSVVYTYPGNEDFGPYGKCVDINKYTETIVNYLQDNPDKWGPEDMYNFKKTL